MGRKDDWCSEKGIKSRAKGLKKLESPEKKCCYLFFFVLCTVIYAGFASLHSWRSSNAIKIQNDFSEYYEFNAYDSC